MTVRKEQTSPDFIRMMGTGLINMTADIAINVDPTKIDIAAGTGQVIDNSNPDSPVVTNVSFGPFTAQARNRQSRQGS